MSSTQLQSDRTLGGAIRNGRMNRRAWNITIMLVLFQIVAFADKAVLGLVAYKAIPELGISTVQFGMIGSAFFFLSAIGSVFLGLIAGRTSVKWVIFAMGPLRGGPASLPRRSHAVATSLMRTASRPPTGVEQADRVPGDDRAGLA